MSFDGNVVLVTGGAGGLGAATVRRLHGAGAAVVIADIADDKGTALAGELGSNAVYVRTDVLDDDSVGAALAKADELGTLRYAVIAHGGIGVAERILKRDGGPAALDGFKKTIDLYLTGTYNVLRLAAAKIAKAEPDEDGQRGAIVMTASIAGYEGQIGQSAYSSAKGGVIGLTLVGARDLSSVGIRVNTIAPGTILTPLMATAPEEMLAKFAATVPFPKRLGRPDEYAGLAQHLLDNTYVNGEVVRIDGAQRFQPRWHGRVDMDLGLRDAKSVGVDGDDPYALMDAVTKHFGHPAHLPRAGLPNEIGPVAAFLASRRNSYMTGANVIVDGGSDFT